MEIEVIAATNAPKSAGPYSPAVRAGGFIFCAGQAGFDPVTGKVVEGGIREQTRQTLRNLDTVLRAAGAIYGAGRSVAGRFLGRNRSRCPGAVNKREFSVRILSSPLRNPETQ